MIKLGAGAKMIPIYWAPQHLKNSTGTESYNFWHAQKKKTPARAAFVGLHSSQGHQNLIIVTDLVSAGKLKILLLKYFKQIHASIGGRAILKK